MPNPSLKLRPNGVPPGPRGGFGYPPPRGPGATPSVPAQLERQAAQTMHRALFVCSQNRLRSPTAEAVFSKLPGLECLSAGTDDKANVPLDPELIEWADTIYAMETSHRTRISKKFKKHLAGKRIVVLNIPDEYEYMEPALIAVLERKVGPLLARYVVRQRGLVNMGKSRVRPNPSLKLSPNGGPRGPGRRYPVHSRQPGPRVPPPVPTQLERQASQEAPLSTIRPWNTEDSLDELTTLLHLAYAPLGAMGLNYTAVDQSPKVTAERIAGCMCYVAEQGGKLVGTATVRGPYESSDCEYYIKPEVAIVNQVAVHPSFQSQGIARALLATCSSWARQHGYTKLALDTAVPATHLVALYRKLGYTEVAQVQWSGKCYRSAVLSRHLSDA